MDNQQQPSSDSQSSAASGRPGMDVVAQAPAAQPEQAPKQDKPAKAEKMKPESHDNGVTFAIVATLAVVAVLSVLAVLAYVNQN